MLLEQGIDLQGDLAAQYTIELIPFLLEGIGGVAALNQADGIHPNAEGERRVADHVWKLLAPELSARSPGRS